MWCTSSIRYRYAGFVRIWVLEVLYDLEICHTAREHTRTHRNTLIRIHGVVSALQIFLQSQQGPVDIYLVSSVDDSDGEQEGECHNADPDAGDGFLQLSPECDGGSVLNLDVSGI